MGFFSSIVNGLKTVTQIVPTVMDLVKVFEVPEGAGKGTDKKEAVLGIVNVVTNVMSQEAKDELGSNKTIQVVASVIEIVVKFFNAIGVFKK